MDKGKLQHLVYLIDDNTTEVREEVLRGFTEYGATLEEDLLAFSDVLNPDKLKIIEPILTENRRKWLRTNWSAWQKIKDEYEQIEYASSLISRFQLGLTYPEELPIKLDKIAQNFQNLYPFGNELDLAHYLFQHLLINGERDEYYNPLNSNLMHVIEKKSGLPISLCVLYMLIGYRVGFFIEGCNFPGHFLAKLVLDDELILVDCFNGGKIIYESDVEYLLKESYIDIEPVIKSKTGAKQIIRRIVSNLINAYKAAGDQPNRYLFSELLQSTPKK